MTEGRSDSATKCGICGGVADVTYPDADGIFNVCRECGAECTGTGAYTDANRYFWQDARTVERGRAALEAAERDAEWAEEMRYGDW